MHRTSDLCFLCGDLRRGEWSTGLDYNAASGSVRAAVPRGDYQTADQADIHCVREPGIHGVRATEI